MRFLNGLVVVLYKCMVERQACISSLEFFVKRRQEGRHISALFSLPAFGTDCVKVDFLYCCDLGVSADYMGSLFYYIVMTKISGASKAKRCATLFSHISDYYVKNNVEDRLPKLVPGM